MYFPEEIWKIIDTYRKHFVLRDIIDFYTNIYNKRQSLPPKPPHFNGGSEQFTLKERLGQVDIRGKYFELVRCNGCSVPLYYSSTIKRYDIDIYINRFYPREIICLECL